MSSIISAGVASASSYSVMDNNSLWTILQQNGINLPSEIQSNQQFTDLNNIWLDLLKTYPNSNFGYSHKAVPNTTTQSPKPSTTTPNNTTQSTLPNTSQSAFATQVFNLVNQERSNAGLNTLTNNSALESMALVKAKDMYNNNYFDHNSPSYGSPFNMMKSFGIQYTYAGENIAKGQRSPQEVMTSWMNSPGHRQNILNPNFTKIGVAYYNGEWVQEFIAN
jgi:uncharacterized YkwD family protein